MKTMRKVGAVVLALCLCLSLCVTAFAASSSDEEVKFTITVNNAADGETYTAYKIFDVTYTYDDDGEASDGQYAYSITTDSAWYDIVKNGYTIGEGDDEQLVESPFTLTQAVDGSYIVSVKEGVTDDNIISFFVDAGVPENAVAAATVEASDGTAVLTVSDPGYYYVTTTLGSLVIIDTTNPTVAIEDKNGQPTVEKYVHDNANTDEDNYWGKEDDADNDSDVLFEIVISNINGAENLVLHDSMDDELSIPDESDFHMVSATLYTSSVDEVGTPLIENTDYTISVGDCSYVGDSDSVMENCAFEVDFTGYDFSDVDATGSIVLTYYLHLDTTGDTYDEDYEQIENSAQVTFGTTSASEEVVAETYTFGFEIFKYTGAIVTGGSYSEVIVAPFSNDNPAEGVPSDELYLMLVDSNGDVTYYATFDVYDADNYIYIITGWVTEENAASYITEPDYGTEEQTAYFYVPTGMTIPEHAEIQLDEDASNPDQETNNGAEIVSATEFGQALADAEFEVTNASGEKAYFRTETLTLSDGSTKTIYLLEGWGNIPEDSESDYTYTITSGSDGMIYVEGFDTGTYTVTEIKAPDGYNLLTSSIEVTLAATYDGGTGLLSEYTVTWTIGETTGEGVVNVENNAGTILPGTGGMGTTIFYIVGAILICGAAVVLITRRRMNRAA